MLKRSEGMFLAQAKVRKLVSGISCVHGHVALDTLLPGLLIDTPAFEDLVNSLCGLYRLVAYVLEDRQHGLAASIDAVVKVVSCVSTDLLFVESRWEISYGVPPVMVSLYGRLLTRAHHWRCQ